MTYILLLGPLLSCQKVRVNNSADYMKWLDDPKNSLVKVKSINGVKITVKYLPPEYLAYLEMQSSNLAPVKKDSVLKLYSNNLTFRFSLGPDDSKGDGSDIIYRGLKEYREYAERSNTMNFEMEQFITLHAGQNEYIPVLSAMENTYGLNTNRSFIVVFAPKDNEQLLEAEKLDFIYADELFRLGTNHFVFQKKDIDNIPAYPIN